MEESAFYRLEEEDEQFVIYFVDESVELKDKIATFDRHIHGKICVRYLNNYHQEIMGKANQTEEEIKGE